MARVSALLCDAPRLWAKATYLEQLFGLLLLLALLLLDHPRDLLLPHLRIILVYSAGWVHGGVGLAAHFEDQLGIDDTLCGHGGAVWCLQR